MIRKLSIFNTTRHAGHFSEQTGKGKKRAVLQAKTAEGGEDTVVVGEALPAVAPKLY